VYTQFRAVEMTEKKHVYLREELLGILSGEL
jgi:hypothetical protein